MYKKRSVPTNAEIVSKKSKMEPRSPTPDSEDVQDVLFENLPDKLKAHCLKYETVSSDDTYAVPQPTILYRPGGINLALCLQCIEEGRKTVPISLPDQRHGLVVPLCAGCSKMNTRIGQNTYFGTFIKNIVDQEKKKKNL